MRPRLGLSPTRPQHDAGMRIDPPPSLAWASGTMPLATAAAEPPLETNTTGLVVFGVLFAGFCVGILWLMWKGGKKKGDEAQPKG